MREFFNSNAGFAFKVMQTVPLMLLLSGLWIGLTDEHNNAYMAVPMAVLVEVILILTCAVLYWLEKRGRL